MPLPQRPCLPCLPQAFFDYAYTEFVNYFYNYGPTAIWYRHQPHITQPSSSYNSRFLVKSGLTLSLSHSAGQTSLS